MISFCRLRVICGAAAHPRLTVGIRQRVMSEWLIGDMTQRHMCLVRRICKMVYICAITVAVADVLPALFTIKGEMVFELIGRGESTSRVISPSVLLHPVIQR
jgi:hypothetical protein